MFELSGSDSYTDNNALDWCTSLWRIIRAGVDLGTVAAPVAAVSGSSDRSVEATEDDWISRTVGLFGEVFTFSVEDAAAFRASLSDPGALSNPDWVFTFDASAKIDLTRRCRVVCTNRIAPLQLADLRPIWLETARAAQPPDHWILLSLRASPDAALISFIESDLASASFGFAVHCWDSRMGVHELLGIEPTLLERFCPGVDVGGSADTVEDVVTRFRELRPTTSSGLPEPWDSYAKEPSSLCFSEGERTELELAYLSRIDLGLLGADSTPLSGTAEQRLIDAWLENPQAPRCCFLLGDFGDGKSFLTYTLARRLLEGFRAKPAKGILPLRLALREFRREGGPRAFLDARLERFGATLRDWANARRRFRTLVILDGFDEISTQIDPDTVTRNIRELLDCYRAPELEQSRILVTSRRHFFESSDSKRLLTRLDNPLVFRLAPIARARVREGLKQSVAAPDQQALLWRIEKMHDPLGLAAKPLFYQMVRDTLQELPQQLDEAAVYESYVHRSLQRKLELLDDPQLRTDQQENMERMLEVLDRLAEQLQASGQPFCSLKVLADASEMRLAEQLWDISDENAGAAFASRQGDQTRATIQQGAADQLEALREDYEAIVADLNQEISEVKRVRLGRTLKTKKEEMERLEQEIQGDASPAGGASPMEQDAVARVGARSLLTRVDVPADPGEWLVDFCHRSVREFFVARRLVRKLQQGNDDAIRFLSDVPVNYEILFFAGRLLRRGDIKEATRRLLDLLERSRKQADTTGFGGHLLTLLASLSPRIPRDFDYRGRNYQTADLEDADLSGIDFSGSSLRRANLSNVDLTGADLSRCDLSDVRLDETAAVQAIGLRPGGEQIIAAYADGTIWEWMLKPGGRPDYRILHSEQGLRVSRIGCGPAGLIWALAGRELLLIGERPRQWQARIPLHRTCVDIMVGGAVVGMLSIDERSRARLLKTEGMEVLLDIPLAETSVFSVASPGLLIHKVDDAGLRLVFAAENSEADAHIPCPSLTSVDVIHQQDRGAILGAGGSDGYIRLYRLKTVNGKTDVEEVFAEQIHDGAVTSLVLQDPATILSGGGDRIIAVTRTSDLAGAAPKIERLSRSLRCTELRFEGLVPEGRRKRLALLVARAEEDAQARPA